VVSLSYVHSQKWETANDGYGFVPGKRDKRVFEENENFSDYQKELVEELEVDSADGVYNEKNNIVGVF